MEVTKKVPKILVDPTAMVKDKVDGVDRVCDLYPVKANFPTRLLVKNLSYTW